MEAVPANRLEDVRPLALRACVIGIDEGQFVSISFLHFPSFCLNQDIKSVVTKVSQCNGSDFIHFV